MLVSFQNLRGGSSGRWVADSPSPGPALSWHHQEGSTQGLNRRHLAPSSTAGILTKTTSKKTRQTHTHTHTHTHVGGEGFVKVLSGLYFVSLCLQMRYLQWELEDKWSMFLCFSMEGVPAAGLFPVGRPNANRDEPANRSGTFPSRRVLFFRPLWIF